MNLMPLNGLCRAAFVNVENDNNLEDAARKKVYEKTGFKPLYLEQLGTWGSKDRDSRFNWSTTTAYFALIYSVGHIFQPGGNIDRSNFRQCVLGHESFLVRVEAPRDWTSNRALCYSLAQPNQLQEFRRELGATVKRGGALKNLKRSDDAHPFSVLRTGGVSSTGVVCHT